MSNQASLPCLLSEPEAAKILGLRNHRTMAEWRRRRQGPAYTFIGRKIRYRSDDLLAFIDRGRVDPASPASPAAAAKADKCQKTQPPPA